MRITAHTPAHRVLETSSTYTHLGIRFWDPVLDRQIRDGLSVTARPEDAPRPRVSAYRTRSDLYAFRSMPGMRSRETAAPDSWPNLSSPPEEYGYIVEVRDLYRRYTDVAFRVTLPLPYRGLYLMGPERSPHGPAPKGLSLYSAITRGAPTVLASVRGELWDIESDRPAAFAVTCLETEDGYRWHGIADRAGRVLILLPYPTLSEGLGGSPIAGQRKPLWERTWDLRGEVWYEPSQVRSLPGSELKDYLSILTQATGQVWPVSPGDGGIAGTSLPVVLKSGIQQILRTPGSTRLLVSPAVSSH